MATNLAPVYMDDARVTLQGDPKPAVAKILAASGKRPEAVQVVRLKNQSDTQGKPLNLGDIIDRTQQANSPVYLKCIDEGSTAAGAGWRKGKTTPAAFGKPAPATPSNPEETEAGHEATVTQDSAPSQEPADAPEPGAEDERF